MIRIAICHLLLAVLLSSGLVAGPAPQSPTGPVPGKFIVRLKSDVRPDMLSQSLGKEASMTRFSRIQVNSRFNGAEVWDHVFVVTSSSQSLASPDILAMLGRDNVEYIEPDYYLEFFDYPTDSLFSYQWYLRNEGQEYLGIKRIDGKYNDQLVIKSGTPGADIDIEPLYVAPPPEATRVVVAIVDSGVDLVHPELQGRFWRNPDEIPGNGVDDDHNGFVDDTLGYDVSGDIQTLGTPVTDNDPTDSVGHGTHIAGIVAANADTHGVVGVAPWVAIMPVKVRPNATTSVGAAGIVYAVNAGAQVINISWGTPFESGLLREALAFARRNGVFVAIAPGNTGDNQRYYPAAYDSTFVVAAGNSDGYMTDFSTYGAHIDVVAPGLDILSLRAAGTDLYADAYEPWLRIIGDDSLYYLADGTSMATPMVAGAAALIWSYRPDITLPELEEIIKLGADDLVDPLNRGDTLVGPDTLSGYGYLNVANALGVVQYGGIYLTEPVRRNRYIGNIEIRMGVVEGYEGSWQLEYSVGPTAPQWFFLAEGSTVEDDSLLYVFSSPAIEGQLNFRLTDHYGRSSVTSCVYVRQRKLEIVSPVEGEEVKYNIPVTGSAYGPDYDSMRVEYRRLGENRVYLTSSTGEFFDSLLYDWTVSGIDTGGFRVYVAGYFDQDSLVDSVSIDIVSAFAEGWPQKFIGWPGVTPACADLNHDGLKELVVTTSKGVYVFDAEGTLLPGFPIVIDKDTRCAPAIYDTDRDGEDEIIFTSSDGIYVANRDGSLADGWPVECSTGQIGGGYAYPNPTVALLGVEEDSAIVIINKIGQILAYEFNGDPYFYSLEGLFASFDPRISDSYAHGGVTSPFVTSVDLIGDGLMEVVASYTSPEPYTGIGVFDGRTGEPAFDLDHPTIEHIPDVGGSVLADLTGDGLPEIITLARKDTLGDPGIWVKTMGQYDLPGWPVSMPAVRTWLVSYPTVGDRDLDGVPEIMCTFFEYDIAALYIFRADGSPYVTRDGRPAGEAYVYAATFGNPTVANITGDIYPEIMFRSGYVLPGTGREMLHILDHNADPLPGWPVATPVRPSQVYPTRYAPLVTDFDNDGLVELILVSDGQELLVWDFDAPVSDMGPGGRFLVDNLNSGVLPVSRIPTDVDDRPVLLPATASLTQNHPNPFNPVTIIRFNLPARSRVSLDVYNVLGQKVANLVNGNLKAGEHEVAFDGSAFASGVYFYRLRTDDFAATKKMVLLK